MEAASGFEPLQIHAGLTFKRKRAAAKPKEEKWYADDDSDDDAPDAAFSGDDDDDGIPGMSARPEIGRASCRERVCLVV